MKLRDLSPHSRKLIVQKPLHLRRMFFVWVAMASVATALAQEPIKATTTLHKDGTRTLLVVNPDERVADETLEDNAGKVLKKTTYQLDERAKPITAISKDARGLVIARAAYKRDPISDRLAEESILDPAGNVLRRRVYSYGVNNRVSQVEEYDAAGRLIQPAAKKTAPLKPKQNRR